jgi:hypothetical protein
MNQSDAVVVEFLDLGDTVVSAAVINDDYFKILKSLGKYGLQGVCNLLFLVVEWYYDGNHSVDFEFSDCHIPKVIP